mmetsp:Transcript_15321/g.27295  ORF Transcript_15321/g.27295 Transcript_15321/m.27295 type:complete len:690 (-) Transcript_15321:205-2274(-)
MTVEFPKECAGCKKKLRDGEEIEAYYSAYKCRKDHLFVCCKVDCQRVLDKRCSKISNDLRKMQHKLNNDGHTSALRRLPPGEREKLKQHGEAESNGFLICPEEVKAADRSVPYCCFIMTHVGGFGTQDDDGNHIAQDDSVPPPPPVSGGFPKEVVQHDDNDLILLQREDDRDGDETPATKQKKSKEKKGKNQKGTPLLFDFPRSVKAEEQEVYPEAQKPAPKQSFQGPFTTPASNMWGISGTAVSQAWNAAAVGRRQEASAAQSIAEPSPAQMPADHQQKISMLVNTTGCSEARAREVLIMCNWNLEISADALFREEPGGTEDADADRPRWGPRAGASQPAAQRQQEQAYNPGHQDAGAQDEQAPEQQPPAPTQPPPPRLPPDWQALWNEEQNNYYYWHVPTNHTTWDAPSLDDGEAAQAMAIAATERAAAEAEATARAEAEAAALRARQEEEREHQAAVSQVCQITGVEEGRARHLLESNQWQMEAAIRAYQAEEERRKQQRIAEAIQAEAARVEAQRTEHRREGPIGGGRSRKCTPGEYICIRHWRPKKEVSNVCIRVFHGERVYVSWLDDKEDGWAYGHAVDDEQKCGYFPQSVLIEVRHMPHQRKVHEFFGIREEFKAPEEVQGYLSVSAGDIVRVLHPLDPPFVWAFVQLEQPSNRAGNVGWLPEAVLCEASEVQGEQGPRPPG